MVWQRGEVVMVLMVVAAVAAGGGKRRVTASGGGDRVDPVVGIVFDYNRKNPPEKFSDGGGVVVAGIRQLRPDMGEGVEDGSCVLLTSSDVVLFNLTPALVVEANMLRESHGNAGIVCCEMLKNIRLTLGGDYNEVIVNECVKHEDTIGNISKVPLHGKPRSLYGSLSRLNGTMHNTDVEGRGLSTYINVDEERTNNIKGIGKT
ncbi:hypothetical protein Tco_1272809 [Tanacetum coccineum]